MLRKGRRRGGGGNGYWAEEGVGLSVMRGGRVAVK